VTFEFGQNGYNFEAVAADNSFDRSKKPTKADAIIESLSTAKTMAQIVETTNITGSYLNNILRDLVNQGKIDKTGRGPQATYIKK
jgi:hypothetical protein